MGWVLLFFELMVDSWRVWLKEKLRW